jgi:3-methyladenine DNA glycosylase Tag
MKLKKRSAGLLRWRSQIEAAVTAAERVGRIDALHGKFDIFWTGAAAGKSPEAQIGPKARSMPSAPP